jgi:HAD superfamily hydrolase (TIGR01549 family)
VIKAVFFDWFNTLARYDPPREETESLVLRELGFDVPLEKVRAGVFTADRGWFEENTRSPIRKRSVAEQANMYMQYQQTVLATVGIDIHGKPQILGKLVKRMQETSLKMHFVLFQDVLPAMQKVKERKLIIGILTNLDRDMTPLCRELGLDKYVDFVITTSEVGADKPNAPIFLAALKRVSVQAAEAIHVGDQYQVDVLGARGVGIKPLLIDRYNTSTDIKDCTCLHTLTELVNYLN